MYLYIYLCIYINISLYWTDLESGVRAAVQAVHHPKFLSVFSAKVSPSKGKDMFFFCLRVFPVLEYFMFFLWILLVSPRVFM